MHHYFKISLIHTNDGHNKFWSAMLGFTDDFLPVVKVAYGRNGTKGNELNYPMESPRSSFNFFVKKVEEKLKKGYRLNEANTPKVIVLFSEIDGKSADLFKGIPAVASDLKAFMSMQFGLEMTIVDKDEETTVDDIEPYISPTKKSEPGNLKDMLKRRKAEAKFVF